MCTCVLSCFFFFQAEDGIRDSSVTGVQTCALPIFVNAVNQRVILGILERAGHRVRVVDDGEQALDILENERFDVIIMDLNMPELGGLDAARAYRFMHPDALQVPIIMLSADETSEAMNECEDAGLDAFLAKP